MRHVKFILCALAVLLAGALAVGFAARAVVAPRAGETVSAGVVHVPSVLGQMAEQVLFYPWSLYDMQTLVPLSEEVRSSIAYDIDHAYQDAPMSAIAAMDALGGQFDPESLLKCVAWNQENFKAADMAFLKDFSAALDDGTPVLLSYALSYSGPQSISWLMTPRAAAGPSEEQRQAALDKVKDDVAGLLWYLLYPNRAYTSDMTEFMQGFDKRFTALNLKTLHERLESTIIQARDVMIFNYYQQTPSVAEIPWDDIPQPPEPSSLEELMELANGSDTPYIQLVTTQDQIVALFTSHTGTMLGVYYDIQLERYSGLGLSE